MADDFSRFQPSAGALSAVHVELIAAAVAQDGGELRLLGNGDFGLTVPADRIAELAGAGLPAHTAPPRVVCSPLTGRIGGEVDARSLTLALEERLAAEPHERGARGSDAEMVIGLDDGTGDISSLGLSLVFAARGPREFAVLLDGRQAAVTDADLAEWMRVIAQHTHRPPRPALAPAVPIGWLEHPGASLVTLGAAVPGGVLDARQVQFLAALERPVVLTPWRTLLLCDLDEWAAEQVVRVLAPLGFVFDAQSPVLDDLSST